MFRPTGGRSLYSGSKTVKPRGGLNEEQKAYVPEGYDVSVWDTLGVPYYLFESVIDVQTLMVCLGQRQTARWKLLDGLWVSAVGVERRWQYLVYMNSADEGQYGDLYRAGSSGLSRLRDIFLMVQEFTERQYGAQRALAREGRVEGTVLGKIEDILVNNEVVQNLICNWTEWAEEYIYLYDVYAIGE